MMLIKRPVSSVLFLVAVLAFAAAPAVAQTGGVRGKVVDPSGNPVEGAQVVIQGKDSARKLQLKTNAKGEFVQIGVFPGQYLIIVTKDTLKSETEIRVSLGDPQHVDIKLQAGGVTQEQADAHKKQMAALKGTFEEGVAALQGKDFDTAIAKFQAAIELAPNCADCYYNLGYTHSQKGDLAAAAAAYEKAGELRPGHADTWNNLVNVYTQLGQKDKAMEASEKAVQAATSAPGGGSASSLYNQGVILWNQNKFQEARDKFDAATKADPKHADAHYRLGMANLNLGDVPKAVTAFETYLQVAPSGPHAEEAKQILAAMKK
jgi:tetratricopeptide (TPR) repeat protein